MDLPDVVYQANFLKLSKTLHFLPSFQTSMKWIDLLSIPQFSRILSISILNNLIKRRWHSEWKIKSLPCER